MMSNNSGGFSLMDPNQQFGFQQMGAYQTPQQTGIPFKNMGDTSNQLFSMNSYLTDPGGLNSTNLTLGSNTLGAGTTGASGWSGMNAYQKMGTVSSAAGAASALANIYMGFKQNALAKKTFRFQKNMANKNYNAQVKDYENHLKDRWHAYNNAAQARGKEYQSLDSYLKERSIGG